VAAGVEDPPAPPPPPVPDAAVAATFVGHATWLVRMGPVAVLLDPIWSERCSPVSWAGPRRVRRPGLSFEALPRVGVVPVSHGHYDHLDLPTLRRLAGSHRPSFVTPLGHGPLLGKHGIGPVAELDWWDGWDGPHGLRVTLVPARHFTARGLRDRNLALWGGFVLERAGRRVYFAGDSGYGPHFRAIGERLGPFDLALLPVGAYEPRWFMEAHHMNPQDAVRAHRDLGGPPSLAMHWGTFRLTDEGIDEPLRALERAREAAGVEPRRFRPLGHGETVVL
jgi:L-ascorbate metabolism protein UlaG (beta-lactamase superfamily)